MRGVKVRTDIAGRRDAPDRAERIEDLLVTERLGETAPRRKVTALSSARVSTAQRDRGNDAFLVVDAWGTAAESQLPALLEKADAILVVSGTGATRSDDLTAIAAVLKPWREKLIGNVVVGKQAA